MVLGARTVHSPQHGVDETRCALGTARGPHRSGEEGVAGGAQVGVAGGGAHEVGVIHVQADLALDQPGGRVGAPLALLKEVPEGIGDALGNLDAKFRHNF